MARQRRRGFLFCLLIASALLLHGRYPAAHAETITTAAEQAILIDANTGTVLFEKNADQQIPPASLAKLATMAIVFEALRNGEFSLDDEFFISEKAWREGGAPSGGSTMFANINSNIRLEDLIRGVIIQSGNDAAITIAENMAGTEQAFAERMNAHAAEIGMRSTHFTNATGLPDENNKTTARDLSILAKYIIEAYPQFYSIYSEPEFTWNNIRQFNRNPLLSMTIGADGMKTGYTEASGYSLVGSAAKDGRRLIAVVSGLDTRKARAEAGRRLLVWGFTSFEEVGLFPAGETVAHASVFKGAIGRVPLTSNDDIVMFRPRTDRGRLRGRVLYEGPLEAPLAAGDTVATLQILSERRLIFEAPLIAAQDVPVGPIHRRALDGLYELAASFFHEQVLDRLAVNTEE